MIIYAGKETKAGFIQEVVGKDSLQILSDQIPLREQIGTILMEKPEYIIYDLEQYPLDPEEIASEILKLYKTIKAEHIFLSDHFSPSSKLITCLYESGFTRFIFGSTLTDKKEELKRAMTQYYDVNPREEVVMAYEKAKEKEMNLHQKQRIGICSSIPRMGASTLAIQLVKYFIYQGYQACLIGIYQKEDIELIQKYYDMTKEDKELGFFQLENVDYYYKEESLEEVFEKPYDFFVYDYGCYQDRDFNRQSYLEKDHKMMVLGYTPKEIEATRKVLEQVTYRNMKYIYNFTSKKDEKDVLEMMGELKESTYLLGYVPDPYELSSLEVLSKIFPLESKVKPQSFIEKLLARIKR